MPLYDVAVHYREDSDSVALPDVERPVVFLGVVLRLESSSEDDSRTVVDRAVAWCEERGLLPPSTATGADVFIHDPAQLVLQVQDDPTVNA